MCYYITMHENKIFASHDFTRKQDYCVFVKAMFSKRGVYGGRDRSQRRSCATIVVLGEAAP